MDRFVECFGEVEDPRADNARHELVEILFISLLASLCGAQSCEDMAEFGRSKRALLEQFLTLRHGTPSHDTFSRVFRLLDPIGFERAFLAFMARFAEGLAGVVALDGKSLKGAYEKGQAHMPRMMVSAFAAETRLTLANRPAAGGNERDAILQLVDLVSLKGCVVTADALHCHDALAERIVAQRGDYVLRLKANRPILLSGAKAALSRAGVKSASDTSRRNGKDVVRTAEVASAAALAVNTGFPGLKAVARLTVEQPRRRAGGALLRPLPQAGARTPHCGDAQPLGDREQPALDPRHRFRRGSCPLQKGQRAAEPRRRPTPRAQRRQAASRQDTYAAKTPQSRLGRELLLRSHSSYAIALPWRGGRAAGAGGGRYGRESSSPHPNASRRPSPSRGG